MKKIKITLMHKGNTPGYQYEGSHISYDIMMGSQKIGEIVHRVSKDTYAVWFTDPACKLLNDEHFRDKVYLFDKERLEAAMTESVNALLELMQSLATADEDEKDLKSFKVETFDGGAYFTFLTSAKDHKKALVNLQTNSSDYRNIARTDRDLTIKVIAIK